MLFEFVFWVLKTKNFGRIKISDNSYFCMNIFNFDISPDRPVQSLHPPPPPPPIKKWRWIIFDRNVWIFGILKLINKVCKMYSLNERDMK